MASFCCEFVGTKRRFTQPFGNNELGLSLKARQVSYGRYLVAEAVGFFLHYPSTALVYGMMKMAR